MALPSQSQDIRQVVRRLADEVERIETGGRPAWETLITTGLAPLDRLLPQGGFRRGTLVEWLAARDGSGAGALALVVAARAVAAGGVLVVVDRRGQFYAPPAVRLGIEPARILVVRPTSDADHAWALDQVLRTRGVAAVWGEPPAGDDAMLRRWQLAAETSGVLGLLVRDVAARAAPSWAELRLVVTPLTGSQTMPRTRRVRVELARARGARAGGAVEIEIPMELQSPSELQPLSELAGTVNESRSSHDETRAMSLASPVAPATPGRKAGRRRA